MAASRYFSPHRLWALALACALVAILVGAFATPALAARTVVLDEGFDTYDTGFWRTGFWSYGPSGYVTTSGASGVSGGAFYMRPGAYRGFSLLGSKSPVITSLPATMTFRARYPGDSYRAAGVWLLGYDYDPSGSGPRVELYLGTTHHVWGGPPALYIFAPTGSWQAAASSSSVFANDTWLDGQLVLSAGRATSTFNGATIQVSGDVSAALAASAGFSPVFYTVDDYGQNGMQIDYIRIEQGSDDASPPVTALSKSPASPDGQNDWYASVPTITLTPDETAVVSYRLDGVGGYSTYSAPFALSGDGTRTVEYFAVDSAGNTETTRSNTFKVDTRAPSGTITLDGGAVSTTWTAVTLDSSLVETCSGLSQMRVDVGYGPGAWLPYQPVRTVFLPLADGLRTVTCDYRDVAGNSVTLSDDITLDLPDAPKATVLTAAVWPEIPMALGTTATVFGSLTSGGTALTGKTVTLWASRDWGTTWSQVATATESGSIYSAAFGPDRNTHVRLVFAGDGEFMPSTSLSVTRVRVKARLSRPAGPAVVRRDVTVTFTGTVAPGHVGKTPIELYRDIGGTHYVRYRTLYAPNAPYSGITRWTLRVRFPIAGRWLIRSLHSDASHAANASSMRLCTVR
jgi:hypothetical protein